MKSEVEFTPLVDSLLPSALRLSTQAGWNQTEEDWSRLIRLNPNGVQVWCDKGEVRVSYSIVNYGQDIAWIGMLLVDTAYRGSGLGKAAFKRALELAQATNCKIIGLDATDMGEPIYRKFGFTSIDPIVRWGGVLAPMIKRKESVKIVKEITPEILNLDRRSCRVDRSALLRDLIATRNKLLVETQDGVATAYAILREGRQAAHLGPVIAEDQQSFENISAFAGHILEGRKLICDLIGSKPEIALTAMGLTPLRYLKRMVVPLSLDCLNQPTIWCGAGFELG